MLSCVLYLRVWKFLVAANLRKKKLKQVISSCFRFWMSSLWGFVFAYSCANWCGYFGPVEKSKPCTSPASCPGPFREPLPGSPSLFVPAEVLGACSLPNDSGLPAKTKQAWPRSSLRTALFIVTKAPLSSQAEELPFWVDKNYRPRRRQLLPLL